MKLGFIGAGNMGGAILQGILTKEFIPAENVFIYDVNQDVCSKWHDQKGVSICESRRQLAEICEWIILCVKPIFMADVITDILTCLSGDKKVISIAAGWSVEMLNKAIGETHAKILRVMPNTPALVGEGVLAMCEETTFSDEDFCIAKKMFETLGVVQIIPERMIDAIIAVSGSSPAYVYMFIDAMADAAVKLGMPRQMAIECAAQAVLGSSKMILETKLHPAVLKDQVCSPGGTTIEAVQVLEEEGMRSAVIKAMVACAEKNKQMTNGSK